MNEQLPSGWEWATIDGLLATQQDGRTIHQGWSPKCESAPAPDDAWGVLKTTAIQPGEFQPRHNKELPTSKEPRPLLEVTEGDLLLTCAGPRSRCGVAALVRRSRQKLLISGKMYRLRFDREHVLPEYVELYLLSAEAWAFVDGLKTGGNESGLNLTQTRFRTLPIPLAPRPEQKRIVTAIEENLSRLDAADAALDAASARLDVADGSLVAETLAGAWPIHKLAEHSTEQRYGTSAKASLSGDVPVLRMGNIQDGALDFGSLKYLPLDHDDFPTLLLEPGDLLFNRTNSPALVGKSAVFAGADGPVSFASYLIRVRLDEGLDPEWAALAVNSPAGRRYIGDVRTQNVGQSNVNGTKLKAFPVPVPPMDIQLQRIACLREQRMSLARLRVAVGTASAKSRGLRSSILSAAFSGQLVGRDPADEPASVLLERIASDRPAHKTRKKTSE